MNSLLYRLYFLCWLVSFSFISQADLSWFLSEKETSHKWAVIPSYKRTASLGHEAIGRIFIYPTHKQGLYLSSSIHATFQNKNNFSYKGHLFYWSQNQSELALSLEYSPTFDFKYADNRPLRVDIPVIHFLSNNHYMMELKENFSAGVLFEFRSRKELQQPCFLIQPDKRVQPVDGPCLGFFFKEERSVAGGMILRYDSRDNAFNPKTGQLTQGTLKLGYDFKNSGPAFLQIEGFSRHIFSMTGEERFLLMASVGGTLFDLSKRFTTIPYVYQFKLGGADFLRGYQQGRWHSHQYYLFQAEIRWPLFPWLQLLTFADAGHVLFRQTPNTSVGLGTRIGIPPSYEQRIRIEFGIGRDQKNVIVAFSKPY